MDRVARRKEPAQLWNLFNFKYHALLTVQKTNESHDTNRPYVNRRGELCSPETTNDFCCIRNLCFQRATRHALRGVWSAPTEKCVDALYGDCRSFKDKQTNRTVHTLTAGANCVRRSDDLGKFWGCGEFYTIPHIKTKILAHNGFGGFF